MGALDSAVKADLLTATPRTFPVVEIQIPGATQYIADVDVGSLCEPTRMWLGKLLDLGPHTSAVDYRQNSFEAVEVEALVEDSERTLGAFLERKDASGSTALIRLISAHPTTPPRSTTLTGVLWSWRRDGEVSWRLVFRPVTDRPLAQPPTHLKIDQALFPFAGPDALGLPIPLLYGYHDSWGVGGSGEGGGAIAPPYVGQYGSGDFRFLLCLAQNKEVFRVLSNAVTLGTGSWSHIVETDRGVTLSFISTTTDLSGGTLTCDASGYDFIGDGTGPVINEGQDVLQHLVHHFSEYSLPAYQSGKWYTGWETHDGLLDLAYRNTLKDFLRKRIYCYPRLSRYLAEDKPLGEWINEICKTLQVYAFWLETGKVAIAADNVDEYDPNLYADPEYLDWKKHELEGHAFTPVAEGLDTINRIFAKYSHVNGSSQATLEVFSPLAKEDASEDLEMLWGPAGA